MLVSILLFAKKELLVRSSNILVDNMVQTMFSVRVLHNLYQNNLEIELVTNIRVRQSK